MKCRNLTLATGAAIAALACTPLAAQEENNWQGEARDAWIDGKIEASLLINTALNSFDINTDVDEGRVTLTGDVNSETERMLAEEITRNIEGVVSIDNQLTVSVEEVAAVGDEPDATLSETDDVDAGADRDAADVNVDDAEDADQRDFSTRFYDLTTTARLKSSFALNDELSAREIEVDTRNGVVTLEGEVDSEEKKLLAEEIATGYDHVVRVQNNLRVMAGAQENPA